ncbi:MAG: hypothetical protein IKK82_06535 [Kiritimatiellae bacterium]|nr:hypothetical protein [Kiritimatiellia bacterium]
MKVFDDRIVIERREFGGGAPVASNWVIPLPVSKERPYDFQGKWYGEFSLFLYGGGDVSQVA